MTDVQEAQKIPRGQREQVLGSVKVNVPLKEWARLVGVKDSYAYEQSRKNGIEGMFRVGKFIRIHLPTYYASKGIEA